MAKIFISYRREDSAYPAQMIHKDLTNYFGFESVVFDVDTIPPGMNFREYLNKQVSECNILLAIIGDQWVDILNKRLHEPDDFVRIEIQAALERQIPVVPILVGKASVPSEKNLPPELAGLSDSQAAEVRAGADLPVHIKRLIDGLERLLAEQKADEERKRREAKATIGLKPLVPSKKFKAVKFGTVAGVIALLIVGIWLYISKMPSPPIMEKQKPKGSIQQEYHSEFGNKFDFNRFMKVYPRSETDRRRLIPERASRNLVDLRTILENPQSFNYVPMKEEFQLLLASWNIQYSGSAERYDESYWYIAEVLSRFDLIAIHGVKQSRDLEIVTKLLGPWWKYIISDVTAGDPGNEERLAYLYDNRRVQFSGLAGEIALPEIANAEGQLYPARQLVRTPYMAGFQSGWFKFIIYTLHFLGGEEEADHEPRVEEVKQITNFLVERQAEHGAWSRNMILLGDFNMSDPSGVVARALMDSGFSIPHGPEDHRSTNVGKEARFYYQIAYLFKDAVGVDPTWLGVVDIFDAVYSDDKFADYAADLRTASGSVPADLRKYYRSWRRREISDHLLLWAQLPINFSSTK